LISNCKLEAAALHSQIHSCKEKSAAEKNAALIAKRMHSAPTAVRRRHFFLAFRLQFYIPGAALKERLLQQLKIKSA
jgi:hypothetical protein